MDGYANGKPVADLPTSIPQATAFHRKPVHRVPLQSQAPATSHTPQSGISPVSSMDSRPSVASRDSPSPEFYNAGDSFDGPHSALTTSSSGSSNRIPEPANQPQFGSGVSPHGISPHGYALASSASTPAVAPPAGSVVAKRHIESGGSPALGTSNFSVPLPHNTYTQQPQYYAGNGPPVHSIPTGGQPPLFLPPHLQHQTGAPVPPLHSQPYIPKLAPIVPPSAQPVDDNVSPVSRARGHQRTGSAHSVNSATSGYHSNTYYTPGLVNSAAPPVVTAGLPPRHLATPSQHSFQIPANHSRVNSVSSRTSGNSGVMNAPYGNSSLVPGSQAMNLSPSVSGHSASPASPVTGNSAKPPTPDIPGLGVPSSYVQQLRKSSASVYSEVPAKVWGLPIGILPTDPSSKTAVPTTSYSSYAMKQTYLRRAMDMRHSHLTPRLLASEVDDDEDGDDAMAYYNSASATASSRDTRNNSAIDVLTTAPSNRASTSESLGKIVDSGSVTDIDAVSRPLSRAPSQSSTKSVDEEVGRIRLFVANPDDD